MNHAIQARSAAAAPVAAASVPTQYLTFTLGGETFAIGILGVKEIIEYTSLTDVPMMSESIRGVINLRGAVVTVMDLSVCFGRPSTPVTKRTCIVIVEVEGDGERQVIGVVVDAVNAVIEIADTDIEPPPAFGAHIRNDFIEGMGKINGRFVILLEIGRVFSGLQLEQAAAAAVEQ